MSRVCMLLHKSVVHDSRVRREAGALARAGHEVTVIELDRDVSNRIEGIRRVSASPPAWVRARVGKLVNQILFTLLFIVRGLGAKPDVVHAHDAAMLLPGFAIARATGARLVYDSHELATGVVYRDRAWGLFVRTLERLLLPRCAAVITVSDGIADRLLADYRLTRRPAVLRNACDLPRTAASDLRARLEIGAGPLVLHQGAPYADRGCDVLLRAVARLPGVHLCFLGDGETDALERDAARRGCADRVHFLPSVPLEDLLAVASGADVGVSLLQPTCDNHRLALPNKLFEYLAAGLPVLVGDLPELRDVVERHGVGWWTDPGDDRAVAAALERALAHRADETFKDRVAAASAELSWGREQRRLLDVYARLDGRGTSRRPISVAA